MKCTVPSIEAINIIVHQHAVRNPEWIDKFINLIDSYKLKRGEGSYYAQLQEQNKLRDFFVKLKRL